MLVCVRRMCACPSRERVRDIVHLRASCARACACASARGCVRAINALLVRDAAIMLASQAPVPRPPPREGGRDVD